MINVSGVMQPHSVGLARKGVGMGAGGDRSGAGGEEAEVEEG